MNRRQLLRLALTTAAAAAAMTMTVPATAQNWPTKPIRLIVGYPPGGPVDTLARLLLPSLGKNLGQSVIVDNKPGASGSIGVVSTVRAEPDGYTFGIGVLGNLAIAPHLQKMAYTVDDINYVTVLTQSPHVLVVRKDSSIKDLRGLVEAARKAPGKINYGSPGTGSSTHLDGELLEKEAGIDIVHVPYKGGALVINALLGDEVQMVAAEVSAVLTMQDKLRVIAVLDTKRSPQLPNVPTAAEQGFPRLVSHSVYGIIAPPRTPPAIVDKFRLAVNAALEEPAVRAKLLSFGQTPMPSTPAEYRKAMVDASGKWGALIRERNLKIE